MKISMDTKATIRKLADILPMYLETYHQREHIHHKDVITREIVPKDYDKNKQYDLNFFRGKPVRVAIVHSGEVVILSELTLLKQ